MKPFVAGAALCWGLFASAVGTSGQRPALPLLPLAAHEGFLVVKENEAFFAPAQELGTIRAGDAGDELDCDYLTLVEQAAEQARRLGANVLRIYEHRRPVLWGNNCHHIQAKALRVVDLTPYEKEIPWHPARRLRQVDFKAHAVGQPFDAATSSFLRYRYFNRAREGVALVRIENVFDCHRSYFKDVDNAASILAHEQAHFDISEIYARRLARALQQQVANLEQLDSKQEPLYEQTITELRAMQELFDHDVHLSGHAHQAWQAIIARQLSALEPYASKTVTVKTRRAT
ncbi:MAG TPA: hypothetical protein VF598_01915 [Hymenobacter sp.]|jgi:hypothetical protein